MVHRRMLLAMAVALSMGVPAIAQEDILAQSWHDIVAQAKDEGEVVWYNWFQQPRLRELVAGFEEEYGIKVTIPDGTEPANFDKFLADSQRPTGDIDVMSIPGAKMSKTDLAAYLIGPLDVLPDLAKLRTQIEGGDSDGYAVAFWGNQTGLAYDPDRIAEADLPQTFDELTAYVEANPMAFAFNDLRNGGAGKAFVHSVVRNTVQEDDLTAGDFQAAWDWLGTNRENYGFTASNADSLTRLNGGEFIVVSAWEDHLASLQTQGEVDERIKIYIPQFGMPGGGNVVGVPQNAPHKAAALLFVSWLTSAKTQAMLSQEMGIAPVNADAVSQAGGSITAEQRAYSVDWIPTAVADPMQAEYLEKVVLQ